MMKFDLFLHYVSKVIDKKKTAKEITSHLARFQQHSLGEAIHSVQ